MAKEPKEVPAAPAEKTGGVGQANVRVDSSALKSSYCNVCNATSTREEVVLNFGINHTWDLSPKDFDIRLDHRIILSPFAAKRLNDVLSKLIKEYEARYGEMKMV